MTACATAGSKRIGLSNAWLLNGNMAFYTPRGIKIRLDKEYAFALLARLSGQAGPAEVLRYMEGLQAIPYLLACAAGILGLLFRVSAFQISGMTVALFLMGYIMNARAYYPLPGLAEAGIFYRRIRAGRWFFLAFLIFAWLRNAWDLCAVFYGTRFLVDMGCKIADAAASQEYYRRQGVLFLMPERNFLNAYQHFARRAGKETGLELSEEEKSRETWKETFSAYAAGHEKMALLGERAEQKRKQKNDNH